MAKDLRVGLIGYKFMGKAHSNAWLKVNRFFDLPRKVVMQAVCGRDADAVGAFAKQWGWTSVETDYRKLVRRDDIDLVDVATPNNVHARMAIAAARAGKHVVCEKPLAMTVAEAKEMLREVKKARVFHMVWHNYRRIPAIALAKRLIKEGRIGTIRHWRGVYLQDWINDPKFPLLWRLRKEICGTGAHGDLNAHLIDLARYLVGEVTHVSGLAETFIKERPLPVDGGGLAGRGRRKTGKVTVDDAVLFLARFDNGAVGTFEATRFATGRKNGWRIEINGSKGSLAFSFEDMNTLDFYSLADPEHARGWNRISVTDPGHPYLEAWWPPGHIIGYEHTFVNQARDIVAAIARGKRSEAPDFGDGLRCQEVLETVMKSVKTRRWERV